MLFEKVAIQIRRYIAQGRFSIGQPLPSIEQLRSEFDVSRNTVHSALKLLQNEGIVKRSGSTRHGFEVAREPDVIDEGPVVEDAVELHLPFSYWHYVGSRFLETMEVHVRQASCRLVIGNNKNSQTVERQLLQHAAESMHSSGRAALIIMTSESQNNGNVDILNSLAGSVPIILVDRRIEGFDAPFVGLDNVALGMDAVRRLLERGHRHIGFSGSRQALSTGQDRLRGYRLALLEAGLPLRPEWEIELLHSFSDLAEIAQAEDEVYNAISSLSERPTAWVCNSDKDGMPVVTALERMGCAVPQDAELIACDNDRYLSEKYGRSLASYDYPYDEICSEVIRMIEAVRDSPLDTKYEGGATSPCRSVFWRPKFVNGDTLLRDAQGNRDN